MTERDRGKRGEGERGRGEEEEREKEGERESNLNARQLLASVFQEDPRLLLELRVPEDVSCLASGSSSQKLQNILFPVPKCWRRRASLPAGPHSRWGEACRCRETGKSLVHWGRFPGFCSFPLAWVAGRQSRER